MRGIVLPALDGSGTGPGGAGPGQGETGGGCFFFFFFPLVFPFFCLRVYIFKKKKEALTSTRRPDGTRRWATHRARDSMPRVPFAVLVCGRKLATGFIGLCWCPRTTRSVCVRAALWVQAGGAWELSGSQSYKGVKCSQKKKICGGLFDTSQCVVRKRGNYIQIRKHAGNFPNNFWDH